MCLLFSKSREALLLLLFDILYLLINAFERLFPLCLRHLRAADRNRNFRLSALDPFHDLRTVLMEHIGPAVL